MRFFLRHQPENVTLVVLSRNLPQLGIANLRVRDQLLEIGSQQLAFNHQEAKQFFDRRLSSPIEAAEKQPHVRRRCRLGDGAPANRPFRPSE
ncbi:HTH-type transcriptional regulator malT [Salmonella bongori]|nr:HTH-type transcriptional regulator malT [Salmonella bongori]